ncbi:MAG: hypothetical protein AAB875_00480, partial [Patescibacteria group bacterium]
MVEYTMALLLIGLLYMKNCTICGKIVVRAKTGMCQSCVKKGKSRPDMIGNKLRAGLASWCKGKKLGPQNISTRERRSRSRR